MNAWVFAAIALVVSLIALHYAGKLIARVTGRATSGRMNVRSTLVFIPLTIAGIVVVSAAVPLGKPLLYVAYGAVVGVASLVSRGLFGPRR